MSFRTLGFFQGALAHGVRKRPMERTLAPLILTLISEAQL